MNVEQEKTHVVKLNSDDILPYPDYDEPWRQHPAEPDFWYDRFRRFRDMGPSRRISDLASQLEYENSGETIPSGSLLSNLYTAQRKYHWKDRARAFDQHLDDVSIAERERMAREIVQNQYRMVSDLTEKTMRAIQQMQPEDFEDPDQIVRAFDKAIRTGSLVIGLPTERTEQTSVAFTINLGDRNLQAEESADDHHEVIDAKYHE